MDKNNLILCEVDLQFGVAKFVKKAKARTLKILGDEFLHLRKWLLALWTNSYFVSTVTSAPLEAIKQYVENQQVKVG